jgi:hypothetical protein
MAVEPEGGGVKPLFIPLKTEFYEAFERGEKRSELRLYGPRWNERTCSPGRSVILSKGYGKQNRLQGVVTEFLMRDARTFGSTYQESILRLYATLEKPIAEIRIRLTRE